jgi:glycosyltransferase involved in cell wall biosynthesis
MKLGIFVGEENWTFFKEISEDLAEHYQIEIYQRKTYNIPLFYGRLNRWASQQGIRDVLRSNQVCFFEWASDLLMNASYMPKHCAIVTRLHSFELYEWAPKINWAAVDKVILVSRAMQQKFVDQYPNCAEKTQVINNGKPLDKFRPVSRKFEGNLGMLCNLTPIKRVYEVILTLYELKLKGYELNLHIGGEPRKGGTDKRYYASIQRAVEKLDLQEQVIFHGHIQEPENWFKLVDVFISNSFWEGQQVALIEAMASSCYCLAHFWDGVEEILPQENIFSTEIDMQRKIIGYYEMSDELKKDHRAHMRSIAELKFDINFTKKAIRELINELGHDGYK